jgi:hypothetical protein
MNQSKVLVIAALAACLPCVEAQTPSYSILRIELVNATLYVRGFCNPSDSLNPNKLSTTVPGSRALGWGVADIVSVNGQPVKGNAFEVIGAPLITPNPTPNSSAIGDVNAFPSPWDLVFLNLDGTLIGTIHIDGLGGPPRPPGAPKEITASTWTVTVLWCPRLFSARSGRRVRRAPDLRLRGPGLPSDERGPRR